MAMEVMLDDSRQTTDVPDEPQEEPARQRVAYEHQAATSEAAAESRTIRECVVSERLGGSAGDVLHPSIPREPRPIPTTSKPCGATMSANAASGACTGRVPAVERALERHGAAAMGPASPGGV